MTQFLSNREIYESVICGIAPQARERLWIAIATTVAIQWCDNSRKTRNFR